MQEQRCTRLEIDTQKIHSLLKQSPQMDCLYLCSIHAVHIYTLIKYYTHMYADIDVHTHTHTQTPCLPFGPPSGLPEWSKEHH